MKLHELKYTEGSRKTRNRVGRGQGSGMVRQLAAVRKARKQEAAEEPVLVSRVDRHRWQDVFQNADSQTLLARNMPL